MKNEQPKPQESLDSMMRHLESIAKNLSKDSGTLESSLEQYEKGIKIANQCLTRLEAAENRVTELRKLLESDTPDKPTSLENSSSLFD